jgi:hypothetical protein
MWKSRIFVIGTIPGLVLIGIIVSLPQTLAGQSASSMMTMANSCSPGSGSMESMSGMTGKDSTNSIVQNTTTANYRLTLEIGHPETMLSMCQVTGSEQSGEVMVSGQMTDPDPMSAHGTTYHLELHIYDIKTGATAVLPVHQITITVTDSTGLSRDVPIAEMFGVQEGVTDLHYGNNVQLTSGSYIVDVSVGHEKASFSTNISGAT